MRPFIAFIHRLPQDGFSVSFPDLPGCCPTGGTITEALLNAETALAAYCHELHDADTPIPPPSLLHELVLDDPDALLVLIPPPPDLWRSCGFMGSA